MKCKSVYANVNEKTKAGVEHDLTPTIIMYESFCPPAIPIKRNGEPLYARCTARMSLWSR